MTSKSRAVMRCGVFCQVAKCALGENGHPYDPEDDVGWWQSRVVLWPSGQALHSYALYWAIGYSSKGLYLHTTMDISSISGCRFGPVSGPINLVSTIMGPRGASLPIDKQAPRGALFRSDLAWSGKWCDTYSYVSSTGARKLWRRPCRLWYVSS